MAKKQTPQPAQLADVPVHTEPTVLEPAKPKRRPAKTLADVFDGYIVHLEDRMTYGVFRTLMTYGVFRTLPSELVALDRVG